MKPVWARKFVYVHGDYEPFYGFLRVIQTCKKYEIPNLVCGRIVDESYYQECSRLRGGALLKELPDAQRNRLFDITKVYVSNTTKFDPCIAEAQEHDCYILCSSLSPLASKKFWVFEHHNLLDFERKLLDAYAL